MIQVGITFLGFLASAYAAVSLVDGMQDFLDEFGPLAGIAGSLSLIIVTAC